MIVQKISKTKELKQGFVREAYIHGTSMILLFSVNKGVILDNHQHPHRQFGYTFEGSYDFTIEDITYNAVAEQSYFIDGHIYHWAIAKTDYYSMDFKYISEEPIDLHVDFNLFKRIQTNSSYSLDVIQLNTHKIYKISTLLDNAMIQGIFKPSKEYFIVVSKELDIVCEEVKHSLAPRAIYKITNTSSIKEMMLNKDSREVLIFELPKLA